MTGLVQISLRESCLSYNLCNGSVDALGTSFDYAVLRLGERFDGAGGRSLRGKMRGGERCWRLRREAMVSYFQECS
jgi:hypothetical protein